MASADFNNEPGAIVVPASAFTLDGFTGWLHSKEFPQEPKIAFIQGTLFIETHSASHELIGIECPPAANTLDGFTEWTYSDDFPEQGKVLFANGRIIFDMSPEKYESHNKLKTAISFAIIDLVESGDLGEFYSDGARFQHISSGISNEPDAMFAKWQTLESGKLAPPKDASPAGKHIDLVGTPDWVCEIVSDSSVNKDNKVLRDGYHQAGVLEYWLIDARGEEIDFQILVWQTDGYVAAENLNGWYRSPVFDREFQLHRQHNRIGTWRYDLKIR